MNKRSHIGTVPEDIKACIPQLQLSTVREDPNEEGKDTHQQLIQKLRRKFFPLKKSPPPPFFQEIFDLVANTCSMSPCKMGNVIKLLERASDVAVAQLLKTASDAAVAQLMERASDVAVARLLERASDAAVAQFQEWQERASNVAVAHLMERASHVAVAQFQDKERHHMSRSRTIMIMITTVAAIVTGMWVTFGTLSLVDVV